MEPILLIKRQLFKGGVPIFKSLTVTFRGKRAINTIATCLGLTFTLVLFGGGFSRDIRAADEATIRRANADWSMAAQLKEVDAWLAMYSDNAVVLPPNDKTLTRKDDIRRAVEKLFALPGVSIRWQPAKIEVARSGDIAYVYADYEINWDLPSGEPATDTGTNLEIWSKQSGGEWKCKVNNWKSDQPVALAASDPPHIRLLRK